MIRRDKWKRREKKKKTMKEIETIDRWMRNKRDKPLMNYKEGEDR